jgi:BirA family biotin operon repressor/biotin-[acetyl-CoA-carboxylase] ligase
MGKKWSWAYDANDMWHCNHLPVIDSTQKEAIRRIHAQPGPDASWAPFLIWTDHQTNGIGRHGRAWADCGHALAITFAWPDQPAPPEMPAPAWSILAGLAAIEGISNLANTKASQLGPLGLKWPNDLMAADAKLGGVLVARHQHAGTAWILAGLGINLAWQKAADFSRPVTDLQQLCGAAPTPQQLVNALKVTMAGIVAPADETKPKALSISAAFKSKDVYADLPVLITHADTGALLYEGINRGINDHGELLLETANGIVCIRIGEVSLLPTKIKQA